MPAGSDDLAKRIEAQLPTLRAFVARHARGLLRFETEEDVVQGVLVRALGEAASFEFRGDAELRAWLRTIARRHVASRHRYYLALRRDAGAMLRITAGDTHTQRGTGGVRPAGKDPGPSTVASRHEQAALATRALEVLSSRDRQLVEWIVEDVPLDDVAKRLGVGYEAAKRARLRAMERFRAVVEAIERSTERT
ncbi:MAG TPA: sigma-70 family RNA polymerase sigma factor [Planctomycetota bacterium]|nr:sigma-70 family RNA polymerase sigma factor [Planctomycetota bacterium]